MKRLLNNYKDTKLTCNCVRKKFITNCVLIKAKFNFCDNDYVDKLAWYLFKNKNV